MTEKRRHAGLAVRVLRATGCKINLSMKHEGVENVSKSGF